MGLLGLVGVVLGYLAPLTLLVLDSLGRSSAPMGAWVALCMVVTAGRNGISEKWFERKNDVASLAVFVMFSALSVAFAVGSARDHAQGEEGEPLTDGRRERQGPVTEGLPPR